MNGREKARGRHVCERSYLGDDGVDEALLAEEGQLGVCFVGRHHVRDIGQAGAGEGVDELPRHGRRHVHGLGEVRKGLGAPPLAQALQRLDPVLLLQGVGAWE